MPTDDVTKLAACGGGSEYYLKGTEPYSSCGGAYAENVQPYATLAPNAMPYATLPPQATLPPTDTPPPEPTLAPSGVPNPPRL